MAEEVDGRRPPGESTVPAPSGWIRNRTFDLTLVVGVGALALLSGVAYLLYPPLFPTVLFLDLWLLGYHHVVATFTRLTFDLESFREHRALVTRVPLVIAAVCASALFVAGPWILATAYLYWQWFHYMRQSYGISRVYQRKAGLNGRVNDLIEQGVIYSVPIAGILNRSHEAPSKFLGLDVKVVPVSSTVLDLAYALTLAVLAIWTAQKIVLTLRGRLDVPHTLYQASHLVVFAVGYIAIENIDFGWLVLNIWHNAQYVLFVWSFNNSRFKTGVDPKRRFLSTISQSRHAFLYFATCILIAGAVYKSIDVVLGFFSLSGLPLAVIVYQTVNFHHYVVDGVVWKLRRAPLQRTLGIGQASPAQSAPAAAPASVVS